MSGLKFFTYVFLLILLAGCATRLENSREYLVEGDKQSAVESLYEHAKENSIEQLSTQEYKTGIDFLALLEQANSPSLLTQIYDLKYSSASFDKNFFIYSGRFSKTILSLTEKWQMTELKSRIALKVEAEIEIADKHKYEKKIIYFAEFAALNLSSSQKRHPNLSRYWGTIPYEKYLSSYKNFWSLAKSKSAISILDVLKTNFINRVKENREQILKVAEKKELSFIFAVEQEYSDKTEFVDLRKAMKDTISEGEKTEKVALDEIVLIKPRVLKASDRLQALEAERRDLQIRNQYTYEERVQCRVCTGRGEVQCSPCRGAGVCRSCDRGQIDCTRCFSGRGYMTCRSCSGHGSYRECRRVWDPCKKCYVEKHFRVDCHSCYGSGNITCGCVRGRVICRRCDGHFQCRTCLGRKFVTCSSCVNGTIIEVRKTRAGKDIDSRIRAAETQQSALLSRLNQLEWMVRREKSKRETFKEFL